VATFQDLLNAIGDPQQHWEIRFQLMQEIEEHTGRWLIVYAANFRRSSPTTPNSIEERDLIGFSDLIDGATTNKLDVLVHSPGGSAEVTEQIVDLLRSKFDDIRFIVPHMAMSAATMLCLSGNAILMDERSALGPIDPQIRIPLPTGEVWLPAQVIIDEFERAQRTIADDPSMLPIYLPWLSQFGPYVQICRNALDLSKELVQNWMREFMFAGEPDAADKAQRIANYFADHNLHKSHARTIRINQVIAQGVKVLDMRQDQKLRDLVWRLYCAIDLLFERTLIVKLFENPHGVNWSRLTPQHAPGAIPPFVRPQQQLTQVQ